MTVHLVIPDTQAKPGVPTIHLKWIGQYIVDKRPDRVIHIGDHADMPSLSHWDKRMQMEGRRYREDIAAANEAWAVLNGPLDEHNAHQRAMKHTLYLPDRHYLLGNHEDRITRAINDDPKLDGVIGLDDLLTPGWQRHGYLDVVWLDGVAYSHYFYNPMTGRPYGGQVATRLKTIGHTFVMGHQQTLDYAIRFVGGKAQHGLVAGACYLHDEDYKGPQGNAHWRGVIMLHEVNDGSFDPMFVSLNYLCRRYEGVPLDEYMRDVGL